MPCLCLKKKSNCPSFKKEDRLQSAQSRTRLLELRLDATDVSLALIVLLLVGSYP